MSDANHYIYKLRASICVSLSYVKHGGLFVAVAYRRSITIELRTIVDHRWQVALLSEFRIITLLLLYRTSKFRQV